MNKLLPLILLACSCVRAQTDLPGPVNALPSEDHMTNYGVCSWNAAQTKSACFKSYSLSTVNTTLQVTDTQYQFDKDILVFGNAYPDATSSRFLGLIGDEWSNIFTYGIGHYANSALQIYSDLGSITLDAAASSKVIQFSTQNTVRGEFDSNGLLVSSLSGGSAPKPVCADSAGLLSAATNCHADINLYQKCTGGPTSLTGSYQTLCSGLTISITGTWLISWTAEFDVSSPNVAAAGFLNINGTPQTAQAFVGAAHGGAPAGLVTASTGAAIVVSSMTSGDTINISAIQAGSGTPVSDFVQGSLTATFLHP